MAVAITADEQDTYPPRVLISVTGLTLGDEIQLYRTVAGADTELRGGYDESVSDTSFLVIDGELPFGTPVTYKALVNGVDVYTVGPTSYVLPGGKVVLSDAVGGLAAEVVILAWDALDRDRQASVFNVGGRNVAVLGELGDPTSTLELYVEAYSSTENLSALLEGATEGIVQIRQPGGYAGVDAHLAVLGAAVRRFSQDGSDERRIWSLQVAEVESWGPLLGAIGYTLQDIADAYTGTTLLNANPFFETDASGWAASSGTLVRSTAQFHEGAASGLLTPPGAVATVSANATRVPGIVPGHTYTAEAWVRSPTGWADVRVAIDWYTAADVFISSGLPSATDLAVNTWTFLEADLVAPATAARAELRVRLGSTPAATDFLHFDEAKLTTPVSLFDLSADFATLLALAQAEF
jgi:hypothetical protein